MECHHDQSEKGKRIKVLKMIKIIFINLFLYPRLGQDGNPNLPVLSDVKTWAVWREMLEDSMLHQQELRAAGLYMYCAMQAQQ